jgi:hypothetical protein
MSCEPISDENLAEIREQASMGFDHFVELYAFEVRALLARLDKAEAGWQDIRTAPTCRGARIIGWCTYPAGAEARIVQNAPAYLEPPDATRWDFGGLTQTVTHWMPLPPPPSKGP